jgi:ABC-type sugar transport system ATPase subunit
VRELTVEQNLLLTRSPVTPWGSIDATHTRRPQKSPATRSTSRRARASATCLGRQQMLEIVRAVERQPRILLLDGSHWRLRCRG